MNNENNPIQENGLSISNRFSNVKKLKQEKKDKTASLYEQISIIEKDINSQLYQYEQEIDLIKEKYIDFAHDLSIKAGSCPRSRRGGYIEPNESNIDEKWIHLTWIQESRYGRDEYDYFSATWEDLLICESKKLPTEVIYVNINEN